MPGTPAVARRRRCTTIGRGLPLGFRLQHDEHAAVIGRRVRTTRADRRVDVFDRLVLPDDRGKPGLPLGHRLERDIGSAFREAGHESGIFEREKSLRNDHVEINGRRNRAERDHQHDGTEFQHPIERPFVAAQHAIEAALERAQHDVLLLLLAMVTAQYARAQHRRQRERDEARDHDRDRDGDGKLAEHASDDATHQQHRDEHRDQRERDRDNREADLARALQRGLERAHPALDVAHDVFQHHDGVVDHEADRERQRQQRHVVDGVVERPHRAAGADQRDRNRERRDEGRRSRSAGTGRSP